MRSTDPLRQPFQAVPVVVAVEERLDEAPDAIPGEARGKSEQEHLAERLLGDRAQRALTIGRLAAEPEGDRERERPDDP